MTIDGAIAHAREVAKRRMAEYECNINELAVEEAYIYYGFGVDEEGEKRTAYWVCDVPKRNSFKAWSVFKR